MKKTFNKPEMIILIVIIMGIALGWHMMDGHKHTDGTDTEVTATDGHSFDDLLDAIEWVESKGIANAIGKDGEVGAYQLKKIYVDDVIKILKLDASYKDWYYWRYDRDSSRRFTSAYIKYYSNKIDDSEYWSSIQRFECMARIHNGGPRGHLKKSTEKYWAKVKARMESQAK